MIHAFEPLRELTTGEYPGADTYWNPLATRSHWLYGQAHGLNYPFCQQEGSGITQPLWVGETPVRSEHTTLKFSGRVNLNGPDGVARLMYYRADGQWIDLLTDANTGALRWFGGVSENSIDLTGLNPANGIWTLKLQLTGAGGWGIVYRAYLTGTTGFPTWPTLPTFTDGLAPSAADINKLRTMQQYLFACAQQSRPSACLAKAQLVTGGPIAYFRHAFQYTGTQRLYYNLTTDGATADHPVYVYLEPDTYNENVDERIATLTTITGDVTGQGYGIDLTGYGLTKGTGYTVEVSAGFGAWVTLNNIVLHDLGGVSRTYMPKDNWAHGDTPAAAQLNAIRDDLNQMYPASDRESPLYWQHALASWQYPDSIQSHLDNVTDKRFRAVRRWRYLHYRGGGRLISADGTVTTSLSDTDPPGGPQVLDLESVAVPYGMEYYVESFGGSYITVAYEDYA